MRKRVIILGVVLLLLAGIIGWQVVACYVANSELQSDMKDLAVQYRFRIGMTSLPTEEELRDSVIAKAKEHGIQLKPQQVTVHETVDGKDLSISIAADYEARINLLVFSFPLHFTPSRSYSGRFIE